MYRWECLCLSPCAQNVTTAASHSLPERVFPALLRALAMRVRFMRCVHSITAPPGLSQIKTVSETVKFGVISVGSATVCSSALLCFFHTHTSRIEFITAHSHMATQRVDSLRVVSLLPSLTEIICAVSANFSTVLTHPVGS